MISSDESSESIQLMGAFFLNVMSSKRGTNIEF